VYVSPSGDPPRYSRREEPLTEDPFDTHWDMARSSLGGIRGYYPVGGLTGTLSDNSGKEGVVQ
jgi:hypothetical protein